MLSSEMQAVVVDTLVRTPNLTVVARACDVSRDQVRTIARDREIVTRPYSLRDTWADTRCAQIMRGNGATYSEIADALHISEMTVWYSVNGRTDR